MNVVSDSFEEEEQETEGAPPPLEDFIKGAGAEGPLCTTRVDLCLLPGTSKRRKEWPLGFTLWQVKQEVETELRIHALVVGVAPPPAESPHTALPWGTTLKDLGFVAGGSGILLVYVLRRASSAEGDALHSLDALKIPECLANATAGKMDHKT